MKIASSHTADFAPITFSVTIESKKELDALATIFNHVSVDLIIQNAFGLDVTCNLFDRLGGDGNSGLESLSSALRACTP